MNCKRLSILVFSALILASLLVPTSIAFAAGLSSHVALSQFLDGTSTPTQLPSSILPVQLVRHSQAVTIPLLTSPAQPAAVPQPTLPQQQPTLPQRQPAWTFPCSDAIGPAGTSLPNEAIISKDWLSGNDPIIGQNANVTIQGGGRLFYTYSSDTYTLPQVNLMLKVMDVLGFMLITPSIMLIGYQLMLGASTFRYAGALEGLSRIILGAMAVAVSYELVDTLISTQNTIIAGIITLHVEHPFPVTLIGGKPVPYRLVGEPPVSYRGIVMPMSRWGCALNDFMGVLSPSFLTNTLGSIIPLFGGLAPLAGRITNAPDLVQRCGELLVAILSFLLWIQVFVRIIFLNYYILMTPLAFGCWALPGGVGQRVVLLWFRGFFTLLLVPVCQLFILTTLPLLLPPMPTIVSDNLGILRSALLEFPLILTLCVMLLMPRVLGASMGKALGIAGSMAGGTVVAIGTLASQKE